MYIKQSDNPAKSENKWEVTLLFVGILLTVVICIIGWYIQHDLNPDIAPAVKVTVRK
jgi:hypothetical protein